MTAQPPSPPPRRLRVAVISGRNHPDFDLALTEVLASEAEILVCASADHPVDLEACGCAEVLRLPWPRHREVVGSLLLVRRMAQAIRRFRPDVVHILSEGQVWVGLLPALMPDLPFVLSLHDVRPHPGDRDTRRIPRPLVRRLVRRCDAVLVHGEGLKKEAAEVFSLDPARVFVSLHPVIRRYSKIARERGLSRPEGAPPRVLFFGRILPYKGLEVLLDADRRLGAEPPRRLVVAGGGSSPALRNRQEDAGLELRLRPISDLETAEVFAAADILALPYLEASQSGVLAIGLAFGLPVLASEVGELGALVRAGNLGLLVPPADPGALSRALGRLLVDAALRTRFGDAARTAADTLFAPEAVYAHVLEAYRFALASRVRGAPRPRPERRASLGV